MTSWLAPSPNAIRSTSRRRPESVRPAMVGFLSLAGGDEKRCAELPEARVESLLADGRLASEPLHVGLEVLADGLEPVVVGYEPDDVVARRGHAHALAQRQERRAEHEDDRAERDAQGGRPAHR